MKGQSKNLYLHVDGDSFFVACELTTHPELRGRPVIVGADRGIAVAMSQEAKKLGVTRGMPVFKIKKLFPEVVILPHHFPLYQDIADKLQQILLSYFEKVEEYSIDECFALVEPHIVKYFGGEQNLLSEIKTEIEKTLGVTYSLGIGRTKALSKLASKLEKPRGVVTLVSKKDEVRALKATSIDDIWGIGGRTIPRLRNMGLRTAYDFAHFPKERLRKHFSKPLLVLQRELLGEPILEVESNIDPRSQKSIQSTATFRPASIDREVIWREIAENAEYACQSARELRLFTNKVSFFVKTSEFQYYFDEVKLGDYTADPGDILNALEPKLLKILPKQKHIRSTGVVLHNLLRTEEVPRDLFGGQEKAFKRLAVEEALDKVRKKYGTKIIRRVSSIRKK